MDLKLLVLGTAATAMIVSGAVWYAKSLSPGSDYDFAEDLRRTFLIPHRSYQGFYNDGKPRRIVPAMLVLGGAGLLISSLLRFVSGS